MRLLLALSDPAAAPRPLRGPSASQLRPPRRSERRPSRGPLRGPNARRAPAQKPGLRQPSNAPLRRPSSRRAAAPREGQAPAEGGPPAKLLGSGDATSSLSLPSPQVSSRFLCLPPGGPPRSLADTVPSVPCIKSPPSKLLVWLLFRSKMLLVQYFRWQCGLLPLSNRASND